MGTKDTRSPPEMIVRNVFFGEPKDVGNGNFEVGVTVLVQVGNKPAYGVTGQFIVNGMPYGNPQQIADGKISSKLVVGGSTPSIAIELKSGYLGQKIYPLKDLELPKAQKTAAELRLIYKKREDKILNVTVAREINGVAAPGSFYSVYKGKTRRHNTKSGIATVTFEITDKERQAVLFVQENLDAPLKITVRAKKETVDDESGAPGTTLTQTTLTQRMTEAFKAARKKNKEEKDVQ